MNFEEKIKEVVDEAIEQTSNENKTMENICDHVNWNYVNDLATELVKETIKSSDKYEEVFTAHGYCVQVVKSIDEDGYAQFTIQLEDDQNLTLTECEMLGLKQLIQKMEIEIK